MFYWEVLYILQEKGGPRNLNLSGHVGFDSLPDQLVNKSVAQGFCFNILCIGKNDSFEFVSINMSVKVWMS